tara:strand:- start:52 stop:423 length:372 start_codon:yes stop_codon:yes gene_type:complete
MGRHKSYEKWKLLNKLHKVAENNPEDGDWIPQQEMIMRENSTARIVARVTPSEKGMVEFIAKRRNQEIKDVIMNGVMLYEVLLREGAKNSSDAIQAVRIMKFLKNKSKNLKLSEDVSVDDLDF